MQDDSKSALQQFEAVIDTLHASELANAIDRLPMPLPDELVFRALASVSKFTNGRHQSNVLVSLMLHFSERTLPAAFEAIRLQLDECRERAHLIIMVSEVTPPALLADLLAVAHTLDEADERQRALTQLARYMPDIFPDVLASAYAIENPDNRLYALVKMLDVRMDIVDEVIAAVYDTQNVQFPAWPLCKLAPYAPQVIPRALQALIDGPPDYMAQRELEDLIPSLKEEHALPMRAVMRHMLTSNSDISPLRRALSKKFPKQSWWGDFPD